MQRAALIIGILLLLSGVRAEAEEGLAPPLGSLACNRLCWSLRAGPADNVMVCLRKINNQTELFNFSEQVKAKSIAIGAVAVLESNGAPNGLNCAASTEARDIPLLGHVQLHITSFTQGTVKIGDVVYVQGTGYVFDQKTTLFFPDPSQN